MAVALEKAKDEVPQDPEQSFLATLSDPQVTLLSVHKQWSFRRSPGARALSSPVSSEERSCLPPSGGEFPLTALNGALETSSHQVSATMDWMGPSAHPEVSVPVLCEGLGRGLGREGERERSPGRTQGHSLYGG